jgi:hypothetical protein
MVAAVLGSRPVAHSTAVQPGLCLQPSARCIVCCSPVPAVSSAGVLSSSPELCSLLPNHAAEVATSQCVSVNTSG